MRLWSETDESEQVVLIVPFLLHNLDDECVGGVGKRGNIQPRRVGWGNLHVPQQRDLEAGRSPRVAAIRALAENTRPQHRVFCEPPRVMILALVSRIRLHCYDPVSLLLDGLLFLALLSTIGASAGMRGHWGPEGPVGAWVLFFFPCLLAAILLATFASRSMLDFVPGGRPVQFVAAAGILVALSVAFLGTLDGKEDVLTRALGATPYLILFGCLVLIHRAQLPAVAAWIPTILLGVAALAGAGVIGFTAAASVKSSFEQSAERSQKEQASETEFERQEVAEYEALPADAPLASLLRLTWSRNAKVKALARQRVAQGAGLDDAPNDLLVAGNEDVIHYVSFVYEKPSAKLAKGWAAMLERQRKAWDVLQYDEHAGKWEPNLSAYFEGAEKLQRAGGDLKPQLRSWYELLSKSKGLGNVAAFVKTLP